MRDEHGPVGQHCGLRHVAFDPHVGRERRRERPGIDAGADRDESVDLGGGQAADRDREHLGVVATVPNVR